MLQRQAAEVSRNSIEFLRETINANNTTSISGQTASIDFSKPGVVLFLGAGFSKFLSNGTQLPVGWSLTWSELLDKLLDNDTEGYYRFITALSDPKHITFPLEHKFAFAESEDDQRFWIDICNLFYREGLTLDQVVSEIKKVNTSEWHAAYNLIAASSGVVTTNYDPVAWVIARQIQRDGLNQSWHTITIDADQDVPPRIPGYLTSAIRDKVLVFLHGSILCMDDMPTNTSKAIDRLRKIVLTSFSYAKAYANWGNKHRTELTNTGDGNSFPRAQLISKLLSGSSLLFLGFSLSDYMIQFCMTAAQLVSQSSSKFPHFAILPGSDQYALTRIYQDVYGVNPIFLKALAETENLETPQAVLQLLNMLGLGEIAI